MNMFWKKLSFGFSSSLTAKDVTKGTDVTGFTTIDIGLFFLMLLFIICY